MYDHQVMQYFLGASVIVDDMESARHVKYEQAKRLGLHALKVVALNGDYIRPNGNMVLDPQNFNNQGSIVFNDLEMDLMLS